MNLALWLERTARVHGDRPALLDGTRILADYRSFHAQSASLGAALSARGIPPGARIALFMANCPDYLVAMNAVWIAGAAVVPINAKLHPREAAWILEDSGAALCLATPGLAQALREVAETEVIDTGAPDFAAACTGPGRDCEPRAEDDLAWLFYTSGTTGRPKGVRMTHAMLMAMSMSMSYQADGDSISPEDGVLYGAPMSHGAGIYSMMHILHGCRHICPPSRGFDAAEVLALAAELGPIHMFMAPTMVRRLTDVGKRTGQRGDGLRSIVYAGGPMYLADIVEAVDWFGPRFLQIYGQGECPMAITALPRADVADRSHPRWRERLASVGRAQSLVELRVAGPTGAPLATGETGEILVQGAPVMPGYWRNEATTAKTLIDGWLWTGDMGRLDADGYLTLQDRSKDMIISGGSNIYPREVEEALLQHPDLREVAVVGRASAEWGEEVVAFVVAHDPAPEAGALDALCLERIARFKRPKAYRFLPELPKNNYGKVLKTELRRLLEEEET
ncbi:AMP-binding protein [Tropicimonas sp. TH_r6]|uniref:AMP-binding protein n=1 Tax=Tropicimonas sp. TH_r6 TaxID=3082085 RepID=UPI00295360F0|nr:AMP-binding protein [Tropicimonas sp. TH_r6]MDV7143483.1 AMP-binding protein [Tropicimonas sp. TH_r6]